MLVDFPDVDDFGFTIDRDHVDRPISLREANGALTAALPLEGLIVKSGDFPDLLQAIFFDGLDPSLVPTTGTPEPGGLGWYETLELIRMLAKKRRIVGMDLVEFSKTDNSDAPAFLCSKLIYKSLAYIFGDDAPKIPLS